MDAGRSESETREGTPPPARPTVDSGVPERIGPWIVEGELGRGGMGVVVAARHAGSGERVAIKAAPDRGGGSGSARFEREALLLSLIDHPGIAAMQGLVEVGGRPFIVMELVEGRSLASRIDEGPLDLLEALDVAHQVAGALDAAHARRIVHRDLKPANVMLRPDGGVKVLDFGLGKGADSPDIPRDGTDLGRADSRPVLTEHGSILGTLAYMSPEQVRGERADARADLWALGVMLFESLSGSRPWRGPRATLRPAILDDAPDWGLLPPDVPRSVRQLLESCLAKSRDERPARARDVVSALAGELAALGRSDLATARVSARGNLPRRMTALIGRDAELAAAREALGAGGLLTLTGPGGSGKTRLALALAEEEQHRRGGGAWMADLAPLAETASVAFTVASALGVAPQRGADPLDAVVDHLREKDILVILDNCEHLLAEAARVASLLAAAGPRVAVVATSREALGAAGEHVLAVPPLALPDAGATLVADVESSAAARLFVERARSADAAFVLDAASAPHVARICRRLDGLPLALELAAARVPEMPIAELGERLAASLGSLEGGRLAPGRHRTLRALVAWSHDLLDPQERAVLRRLAMLHGPFVEADADAVAVDGDVSAVTVRAAVRALVRRSLLAVVDDEGGGRFRLLESVCELASARLDESGELAATRSRLLRHLVTTAGEAQLGLGGREQLAWLRRLDDRVEDVRAAARHAERVPESRAEVLVVVASLEMYWRLRGRVPEASELLEELLAKSGEGGDAREPLGPSILAAALRCRSRFFSDVGRPDDAHASALGAVSAARDSGDARLLTSCVIREASTLRLLPGGLPRARRLLEETLARLGPDADPAEVGRACNELASAALQAGENDASLALWERALAAYEAAGDLAGVARAHANIAYVFQRRGDLAAARVHVENSLALRRTLGSAAEASADFLMLGNLAALEGDIEAARSSLEYALREGERSGRVEIVDIALNNLAELDRRTGHFADARLRLVRVVRRQQARGARFLLTDILENVARLDLAEGARERAAVLLGAAERLREDLGTPVPPFDRAEHEASLAALEATLGSVRFEELLARGRALDVDEACSFAVGDGAGAESAVP